MVLLMVFLAVHYKNIVAGKRKIVPNGLERAEKNYIQVGWKYKGWKQAPKVSSTTTNCWNAYSVEFARGVAPFP